MKKLIFLASLLAAFVMTACNNELGEEYKNPAQISEFAQTFKVFNTDSPEQVPADTEIVFSGRMTSTYGPVYVYVQYQTCTREKQLEYTLGEFSFTSVEWQSYWQRIAQWSNPDEAKDELNRMDAPVKDEPFTVVMPGQPAGTVVRLALVWQTPYLRNYAETYYTVGEKPAGDEGENDGEGDEGDEDDDEGGSSDESEEQAE